MTNAETAAVRRYHEATKHSPASIRADRHVLDWDNQPLPFKIYPALGLRPLPRHLPSTGVPALRAIATTVEPAAETVPTVEQLAYLLFSSAGIVRTKQFPGGTMAFRAASCTGALYEIDLYVACRDLDGLEAGVYHFDPAEFGLRQLRRGDFRAVLGDAAGGRPPVVEAPVLIVSAGTYWRNAWKYRARTYRHFGWDNGTILTNLLAACAAHRLPAEVACGFVDDMAASLLGLDETREAALSIVPIGRVGQPPPPSPPVEPLHLETTPLSAEEVDYPIMRETHAASSLRTVDEVRDWRGTVAGRTGPSTSTRRIALRPPPDDQQPADPLEDVIQRRGSTRRFDRRAPWTFEQFSTALVQATRPIPADFHDPRPGQQPPHLLNRLYLIVHAVDGIEPGAYALDAAARELELLETGDFRDAAGFLGLEQELPADASFVVFFLADLDAILDRFGNRGYRAVQLEAGILGGRLYLASYAQRLGASGLTFYDDDVVRFFSPHAAGLSAIFCMTHGRSVRLVQMVPR